MQRRQVGTRRRLDLDVVVAVGRVGIVVPIEPIEPIEPIVMIVAIVRPDGDLVHRRAPDTEDRPPVDTTCCTAFSVLYAAVTVIV